MKEVECMDFKPLIIKNLVAPLPIVQGGMGIGISLSSLASAVAACGGIAVISAAQIGFEEEDFGTNPLAANIRALKKHIEIARLKAPEGIIGVNIMCAANNYEELVKASIEAGAHIIISGAGLPTKLPSLCKDSDIALAPIVSSDRSCEVLFKLWHRHYNRVPDAVVFEGPEAGGHLGFKIEELENRADNFYEVEMIKILKVIKTYEEMYDKHIPLITAGGVYSGADIAHFLKLGASGVQMATRFVATDECDAHINFKKAYVECNKEDIVIVKSPVGMPGRALNNAFVKRTQLGNIKVKKCHKCLTHCNPAETPYCITEALINAVKGNIENALIFCGSNAYKINSIVSVKELMDDLAKELKNA